MPFNYRRRIRFQETDAAGVVYFANLIALCHEAYEAALTVAGFDLSLFFSRDSSVVVPVVHTAADFYQPLSCGEAIALQLVPVQIAPHSFEISYQIYRSAEENSTEENSLVKQDISITQHKPAVRALTRHVCIDSQTRRRQALTPALVKWIEAIAD